MSVSSPSPPVYSSLDFPIDPTLNFLHLLARLPQSQPRGFPLADQIKQEIIEIRYEGREKRKQPETVEGNLDSNEKRRRAKKERRDRERQLAQAENEKFQQAGELGGSNNQPFTSPFGAIPLTLPSDYFNAAQLARFHAIEKRRSARRPKLVDRGSSPSHFFIPAEEEKRYGPEYHYDLPYRERFDGLLRGVANYFYPPKVPSKENWAKIENPLDYGRKSLQTIDLINFPLRHRSPLESWTFLEIACFESGITAYGRDFGKIQRLCFQGKKSTEEIVEFYYKIWKKSLHYQEWKHSNRNCHEKKENPLIGLNREIHLHFSEELLKLEEEKKYPPTGEEKILSDNDEEEHDGRGGKISEKHSKHENGHVSSVSGSQGQRNSHGDGKE